MARLGRRIAIAPGAIVACLAFLLAVLSLAARLVWYPSKIVDFHPTHFPASAGTPFFYSIGDELKFSDQIDPRTPTLFHGKIWHFLVSPDGEKIAIVANGKLVVVNRAGPVIRQVTPVDSVFKGFLPPPNDVKPIGQHYFRDNGFQWSKDSKSL